MQRRQHHDQDGTRGRRVHHRQHRRQALDASLAPTKLAIGQELTKGLGAGANPEIGRKAALEDYAKISELLAGADMVFITAGMGGGTGTGAAPVFAKIAKEVGALTVGVVTKPFHVRRQEAHEARRCWAWLALRENVDSLIVIPNQRLLALAGTTLSMIDAFKKADEVLLNAVQGISDLINHTGLINSDFADVKTIMQNKGMALMGIGYGEGEHRAVEAATNAISSPLLEDVSIDGATGIIINITGGSNLKIHEVNEATTLIMEAAHEDAEIIFGTVIDETMKDAVKVTVIATGLGNSAQLMPKAEAPLMVNTEATAPAQQQPGAFTPPPAPNAAMIAQQPAMAAPAGATVAGPYASAATPAAAGRAIAQFEAEALAEEAPVVAKKEAPTPASLATGGIATEGSELARARAIAQRLGITNLTDDEYDIPTYMRRQSDREV